MKSVLLATLTLAFAAPVELPPQAEVSAAAANDAVTGLTPLVSVADDGSLWIGTEAKERLLGLNVQEIAQRHNVAKRGLQTTQHFCFGGRHHHGHYPREHCEPVHEPCFEPLPPPPPHAPCEPCEDDLCCDDSCRSELKGSCYTKWFCPSTYCGDGICPEDPYYGPLCYSKHPVVDGLRRNCATKWFCPSTYYPSNWCCDDSGCCDDSCWCPPCGEPDYDYGCDPHFWDEPPHEPAHEPCCF